MSLSARDRDTLLGGNPASMLPVCPGQQPVQQHGRRAGHLPCHPTGDQGWTDCQGDTFPICILGFGPGEPSSRLRRTLLCHATPVPGAYEDLDMGGAMLPYNSYFKYVFILIVRKTSHYCNNSIMCPVCLRFRCSVVGRFTRRAST